MQVWRRTSRMLTVQRAESGGVVHVEFVGRVSGARSVIEEWHRGRASWPGLRNVGWQPQMLQHAPNDGGVLDERDELAPPATARTKRAPMTRKWDQPIEPTPRTPEPRDASPERATSQQVTKLLFHEAGEALPVAQGGRLRTKHLEVIAHHLIQNAARGLPRLIRRRR